MLTLQSNDLIMYVKIRYSYVVNYKCGIDVRVGYDIALSVDSHFLRRSYDSELCKSKSEYHGTMEIRGICRSVMHIMRVRATDLPINARLRREAISMSSIATRSTWANSVYARTWKDFSMENSGSEAMLIWIKPFRDKFDRKNIIPSWYIINGKLFGKFSLSAFVHV